MSLQSNDLRYRLGFIGGGKLAGSVMRGLVRAKFYAPQEILVSEPNESARASLAELGLAAAVRELVHQYADRDHFQIETELAEVGKPPVQDLLYRAARELLTNVVKHADATHVLVRLERDDQWITLSVIDNGSGFDPALVDERITEGHIGLASLVARAEAMGGTMDFVHAEGGGTRAIITTPATAD